MSLPDDYRTIREGAAIGSIAPRVQVAVAGEDRASYLQGLLTNDIPALRAGTGCYAAWLTPQGRMHTDMHVLESGGMILLDLPEQTAAATVERLEQFIFTEDVRVESLAETLAGIWLHGPLAADVLARVVQNGEAVAALQDYQHAQFDFDGSPVSIVRIDQLGVPGYCAYLERPGASGFVSALEAAGARPVGSDALEAARVEAGYPVFGIDMTETTIPLEAGIEQRAISFTKGCYVGQEVIIRVLHRGGGRVAKKLVAMRVDQAAGDAVRLEHGAKLHAAGKAIGEITTAAVSPRSGSIALGYVHRDFTAPGAEIEVEAGDSRLKATVVDTPIA